MSMAQHQSFLDNSVPLRMLRARNLPLILTFCYREFKANQEVSIPYDVLVAKLADYLEAFDYQEQDDEVSGSHTKIFLDYPEKARLYIDKWIDAHYLRNVMDDQTHTPVVLLSKHIEKVYRMLDMLVEREFVGTESKFRDIFHKLRDLIENANADTDTRLTELEKRKQLLEEEIRRIKADGYVSTYEDYQIKSRFEDILRLAGELVSDFREVEDNFKQITRKIYEKQQGQELTKGQLISETFDALFELRATDQGRSFYAFWHFMLDDRSQDELQYLTRQVYQVLEDRGIEYNGKMLRRLKSLLHQAGRKVLEKNDLLADKLSREIIAKDASESRAFRELMNTIRQQAFKVAGTQVQRLDWMSFEGNPDIYLPLERKPGEKSSAQSFVSMPGEASAGFQDFDQLSRLYNADLIDKKILLNNIKSLLKDKNQVSLKEVTDTYGLQKGLAELLAYVSLLSQYPKHTVLAENRELIRFDRQLEKYLDLPQIIFTK